MILLAHSLLLPRNPREWNCSINPWNDSMSTSLAEQDIRSQYWYHSPGIYLYRTHINSLPRVSLGFMNLCGVCNTPPPFEWRRRNRCCAQSSPSFCEMFPPAKQFRKETNWYSGMVFRCSKTDEQVKKKLDEHMTAIKRTLRVDCEMRRGFFETLMNIFDSPDDDMRE